MTLQSKTIRRGILQNGWLVAALSVGILGVLALVLWAPWNETGIERVRIKFFCAAGMQKPVRETIKEYREAFPGAEVEPVFAGSGVLYSQIETARGKGDLYLSADTGLMEKAIREKLVVETIPIAEIRPVLIVSKKTQEQLSKKVTSIHDLFRADLKVVIGQPKGTAVGRLTKSVLEANNLWKKLEKRQTDEDAMVSHQGTVNEVANVVQKLQNYVGIIWDANAKQIPNLEVIDVPEFADAKQTITIGVLANSKNPRAALQFARYLTAKNKGMKRFKTHHFNTAPEPDVWTNETPVIHLSIGAMLKPGVEKVIKQFEKREGVKVIRSYAGCGVLVSQMKAIKKGAGDGAKSKHFPDAYFSCDTSFLNDVQDWFEAGRVISKNDIVMIAPPRNAAMLKSFSDLKDPKWKKIGLAHPKNSALGKLTDNLLIELRMKQAVYKGGRVTHADAAHDLVNKMRTGAFDVAVVYRSNVMSNPKNLEHMKIKEMRIDKDLYKIIATQPFAIAKDSQHKYLMKRLLKAILDPTTAERFREIGFHWEAKKKSED